MKEYSTPDLSFAAFLLMKSVRLISANKLGSGKFNFTIDDPDQRCQELAIVFLNSEFAEYDNHVRNLKRMIYSRWSHTCDSRVSLVFVIDLFR